jgi:hypothetical protein
VLTLIQVWWLTADFNTGLLVDCAGFNTGLVFEFLF